MDPMAAMMKNLGNPEITAELKQTITGGVLREAGNRLQYTFQKHRFCMSGGRSN